MIKDQIVGVIYLNQECCDNCGKVGQQHETKVYTTDINKPQFDRNNIPIGWYSFHDAIYCSEECMNGHRHK